MSFFPSFRRPCPYQANLSAVMDGDWCRMCGQQVHDITDLDDEERLALLRRCDGDICVSYRIPVAAALAAALVTSPTPAFGESNAAHHARSQKPVEPPVLTLAGAPVPIPPENLAPPSPPTTEKQPAPRSPPADLTPPAGPRSSR